MGHPHFEPLEGRRLLAGEPWGAFPTLIGLDDAIGQFPSINGAGQTVAVIDTGVDYRHPALGGGIGPGFKVVAGWDFADNDSDPMDTSGHGTGVAGVIAASEFVFQGQRYRGLAPSARIAALRVGFSDRSMEQALQWVIEHRTQYNITAINISTGEGAYTSPVSFEPYGDELSTLASLGVFISASSGNSLVTNPPSIEYPAAHPSVYAIGSVNSSDVIVRNSERSNMLDLLAPGENVPTPYYNPSTREHIYLAATGTSFAAPHAAAMSVLVRQVNPSLSPAQIMGIIQAAGASNFDGDREANPVTGLTFKRLDVRNAIALAYQSGDDSLEENDSPGDPTQIAFNSNSAGFSGLKLLPFDNDFFRFSLTTGARLQFNLSTSSGAVPAFDLLSSSGSFIATLGNAQLRDLAAGTYLIRVVAPSQGLGGTYDLSLALTPDDAREPNNTPASATAINLAGGSATLTGLRLLGDNDDYFSFSLSGTSIVSFNLGYDSDPSAFPNVQLLNESLQPVLTVPLGQSTASLAGGKYYLRYSSSETLAGFYSVSIAAQVNSMPSVRAGALDAAYDSVGNLHLVYFDNDRRDLRYIKRGADGVWSDARVIDDISDPGLHLSLAIDQRDRPGIAYSDADRDDLIYAHFNGKRFVVSRVDSKGSVGEYPSLAYSNANRPAISYFARTGADLRLATQNKAGRWNVTTIDSAGNVGRSSSLALNPSTHRFGVAYLESAGGTFKYAEQNKKNHWAITKVRDTRRGGGYISLGFDSKHRPAFSFFSADSDDLFFAHRIGGKWAITPAATKGSVGRNSHLQLNPAGGPTYVYYYREDDDAIYFARSSAGKWSLSRIATGGGSLLAVASSPFSGATLIWRDSDSGLLRELDI